MRFPAAWYSDIQNELLEHLKARYHRVVLRFDTPLAAPPPVAGFFNWQGRDRSWSAYFRGDSGEAARLCEAMNTQLVELETPSLNEIFVALVGSQRPHARDPSLA